MSWDDEAYLKRLMSTFRIEAEENLRAISAQLVEMEQEPVEARRPELLEAIFRRAHSIKGAARSVNLPEFGRLCQAIENVFDGWKNKHIQQNNDLYDALHTAVDHLLEVLALPALSPRQEPSAAPYVRQIEHVLQASASLVEPDSIPPSSVSPMSQKPETPAEDKVIASRVRDTAIVPPTIRIPAYRLDGLMLQTEELLSAKQAASQQASELWALANSLKLGSRVQNGVTNVDRLSEVGDRLVTLAQLADRDQHALAGMVDNLLNDMKLTLMQPFSSLLDPFPKWARDLSRDQGKEVELTITGAEIEIDRRILEEMKDPLVHMLRNAIDHGIEPPAQRQQAGKPTRGKIAISVRQKDSSQVELIFTDDGRGINVANVKAAISKSGALSAEEVEQLSAREIRRQVFNSGITTSLQVTDVSGRGLGLAIVQERVNALGGQLSLQEQPEGGTSLRILLPLTIATFRGIIVRVQKALFVLPTLNVLRVMQVKIDQFGSVGERRTLRLDGELLSVVHLADILEMSWSEPETTASALPVIIIGLSEQRLALLVDELLNEQEILVKSLGPQLSRVRNIAAATILGSGRIVPILNVADLIKSGIKAARRTGQKAEAREKEPQRLLVVDDSITSRTLLKNILETAGYHVETAVDGQAARRLLQRERFDLVVSDVDMPHMNGFDLTTAIREDPDLARLPVILVTSLADPDDRQMGARVGADAYIVKSEFEQQSLLATISSLI